jgi:hypothetical protein
MAPQQLQRGLPVVVPTALRLERIDRCRVGAPAAVVVHCLHDGASIAAGHIPDHAIDIEEQNGAGEQESPVMRLVG